MKKKHKSKFKFKLPDLEYLILGGVIAIMTYVLASGAIAKSETTIFNDMRQSIMKVTRPDQGGGTGFLVQYGSRSPVTLTNAHVCGEFKRLEAERPGDFAHVPLQVLKVEAVVDLCALTPVPGKVFPLYENKAPAPFTRQYSVGFPYLGVGTPQSGQYVEEVDVEIFDRVSKDGSCPPGSKSQDSMFGTICGIPMHLMDTTLIVYPGQSGSPMMDSHERITGVINSTDTRTYMGSAIPVRFVRDFLRDLK